MAFTPDIVLNNGAATPVAKTFTTTTVASDGTTRLDTGTTDLSVPRTLVIKHAVVGNDKTPGGASDRHLLSVVHKERDAVGNVLTMTGNFTLTVPRNALVSRGDVDDVIAFIRNFLVTANVDKFLQSQS